MPATLAPEITIRLLREQLGFNGLVVTTATRMAGFKIAMSPDQAVLATIASGCDVFLFTQNLEEDLNLYTKALRRASWRWIGWTRR